jgi:hypothetical protein
MHRLSFGKWHITHQSQRGQTDPVLICASAMSRVLSGFASTISLTCRTSSRASCVAPSFSRLPRPPCGALPRRQKIEQNRKGAAAQSGRPSITGLARLVRTRHDSVCECRANVIHSSSFRCDLTPSYRNLRLLSCCLTLSFQCLWKSIIGNGSRAANPWVGGHRIQARQMSIHPIYKPIAP